jgi:hypothetical protein
MNILWKQTNDVLAITTILDGSDPTSYAQLLQDRGDIPSDWILLGTNVEWSSDTRWKHETYRYNGTEVVVDYAQAVEETKDRLRADRAPLLAQLDIDYIKALETNADTTAIIVEKQRLRDITNIDSNLTLDELINLTV